MPFVNLPSSPGFTPPQAPDWTRFGLQANELIAHRPIINTAEIVNQAVDQINKIIQMSSPQAKLQRQLQTTQLQAMQEVYNDYRINPGKYQMTAHGPVLIDPYARAERVARIRKDMASTALLSQKAQGSKVPTEIAGYMDKMKTAMNYENQGGQLPSSTTSPSEPIEQGTTDMPGTTDTSEITPAESAAMSDNSPETFDPSAPYNE